MKKKGGIIVAVIGVLLLIVGGVVLLLLSGSKKTNKELYTEALEKSIGLTEDGFSNKEIEKTIKDITEKLEKNKYKITIKGETSQDEASYGNLDGSLYFGKEQFYLKLNASANDKVYDLESMLKDYKLYFSFKNVLSKVYYVDGLEEIIKESAKVKDNVLFNNIVNYLMESFKDAIKEDQVKTDKTEITINGKAYKANQYGYTFSGNTLYEIIKSFIEKVKNDDSIIKEINKLLENNKLLEGYGELNITKDDFNALLDQALEAAKQLNDLGDLLTYTVYMYDDEPISRQISATIPSEQGNTTIRIADFKADKYYKVSVSAMGMEVYKLEVIGKDETTSNISFSMMNQELIKGTFKNDDGNYELILEPADTTDSNVSIVLKINKNGTGSLEVNSDTQKMNINYEIEEVDEIPEMDVSNSVSYEEMTEEDKMILSRFLNPVYYVKENNVVRRNEKQEMQFTDSCQIIDGELVCNEV